MADIGAYEADLRQKAQRNAAIAKTPVEKLRFQCLQRGVSGIKGLANTFRIMDDSGDRKLDLNELVNGIRDYGLNMSDGDIENLFGELDADGSGNIIFDEFLKALRPPMSQGRLSLIDQAFEKLDKTGDGVITIEDLKGVYNAKHHPKYQNGELTEEQVFRVFLKNFDAPNNPDGQVTKEEFVNYYSGVSASIDTDCYFDLMMRNSWKL